MKALSAMEAANALAMATGKWVLYISFAATPEVDLEEIEKAVPYLSFDEHSQILCDGQGFIVCESQEECERLFNRTVGDDGPTELNPYDGPARVYALTICPRRGWVNENT